nr:MAG TPA: hypothetical protein [Caudoviricetes sp.]
MDYIGMICIILMISCEKRWESVVLLALLWGLALIYSKSIELENRLNPI